MTAGQVQADDDVEAWAAAAAGGDSDAMGRLYETYVDSTYRFVYVRVKDHAQAEDVTADVWLKVARTIHGYNRRGGGFVCWVHSITRTVLIDSYRAKSRRPETPTADMLDLDLATADSSPEEVAERRDTARAIAAALTRLTAAQAECVTLRFFDGLTIAETAQVMGSTIEAVKVRQHRALRALAKVLPPEMRTLGAAISVPTSARVMTTMEVAR